MKAEAMVDGSGETATLFESDDAFRAWVADHQRGFVLNVRSRLSPDYVVLHRAVCPSLARAYDPGAFTENDYRKVGADAREELDRWVVKNIRNARPPSLCKRCKPLDAGSFASRSRPHHAYRASEFLTEGAVYSRQALAQEFSITDATLNTGVFQPKGSRSIWLFVTRKKTSDRTQYEDRLEGDVLHWEGQTSARSDGRIINHEADDNELLLFYRESKQQHPQAGFTYQGQFLYLSHEPGNPSSFILQRLSSIDNHQAGVEAEPFDPTDIEDGRQRVLAMVARRQGQPKFRRALMAAYGGQCAISDCPVESVLEAAHIHPYQGEHTNHVSNGILLRADLHTLFDLRLLWIEADGRVELSERLRGTHYWEIRGRKMRGANNHCDRASEKALNWHRNSRNSD